jgi:hypothetical protein
VLAFAPAQGLLPDLPEVGQLQLVVLPHALALLAAGLQLVLPAPDLKRSLLQPGPHPLLHKLRTLLHHLLPSPRGLLLPIPLDLAPQSLHTAPQALRLIQQLVQSLCGQRERGQIRRRVQGGGRDCVPGGLF